MVNRLVTAIRSPNRPLVVVGFAGFGLALLIYAVLLPGNPLALPLRWQPIVTLLLLILVGPLSGVLIGRSSRLATRLALLLLLLQSTLALLLIAQTGGAASQLWGGLLFPLASAPLLLSSWWLALLVTLLWLAYGSFFLVAGSANQEWLIRGAAIVLVTLLVQQLLHGEERLRRRAERRERVLRQFLALSNRLRVSTRLQAVLEDVATAVQAAGDFDCVALSRIDWREGSGRLMVVIGATGRRLTVAEGLQFGWSEVALLLDEQARIGQFAYRCSSLPYRRLRGETHLLVPLSSSLEEILGLLTVSVSARREAELEEALPLLELLANQAAGAIENNLLFRTLEQRVQQSTHALELSNQELRAARDRAETLYQIARALSETLDERKVLEQALDLLLEATGASHGRILLVEPGSGLLVTRTERDRNNQAAVALEPLRELAARALASRAPLAVPDTRRDLHWQLQHEPQLSFGSALAVPLLLDREALGVLALLHPAVGQFDSEQAQLAMAAAGQVAVALSKAQLYRYVNEQSERLSQMLQQREEEASKNLAILRSIGDGVVVGDRLGRVRLINSAAEQILGISAETFLNRPLSDLPGVPLEPRSREEREAGLQQIQLGERTLRANYAPVHLSNGEWFGNVVVYQDITREVLADRLKSEFVATASHELRTPLTAIRGFVDLLLLGTSGELTPAQSDFLQIVKQNVVKLHDLVNDLLDMSQVEAGEVRLRREAVDLSEVVYEVAQALQSQFRERDVRLELHLQGGLPAIQADKQRLRQIVMNLVGNACKYTPGGGKVDVALRNGGNELRVDVRDTGVGISDEAQVHIFTPFFRADNPLRDSVGGTGLGLHITRNLIELHGGQIWFESQPGEGTTFSFTLPLSES